MKSRNLLLTVLGVVFLLASAASSFAVGPFTVSVAVTGLTGTLVMQDSKAETLTFTSNTTQTFPTAFANGTTYTVRVKTQPAGQTCTLSSNSTGTITANTTVTATCAPNTSSPTLSVMATGLTGTLVVQDSLLDSLTFTTNTTQTFAQTYTSGSAYSVTIQTQPAGQTCTLSSNASGTITANTTVTATCSATTNNFTMSVAVSGLTSGSLVMQDSNQDLLTFTANGTQTFTKTYASGAAYTVRVKTQPAGQTCTLSSNAVGTITANTTVTATCAPNTSGFTMSVAVSGLTSGSLVMQDSNQDLLTFTTNGTQTFAKTYASGAAYTVRVKTQPAGQTCTLTNATGTVTANTTVTATCASNTSNFTLSVAASGLTGTLVVQDSQADSLTFTTNTTQTFTKTYTSGSAYSATIQTQPAGQTCTLGSNASGTITANTTVAATCVSNFTLSLTATGLTGTLVVQDSQADSLTFTTNTTQSFAKTYANGAAYSVTIQTQPAGQTCTLSGNASGTMTANTTVTATCASNFTLSVTASGLVGTLVVQDSQADSLTFTTNNTQSFAKTYANGAAYSVTIQTQPAGQTCTLSGNASGTMTANTTVTATCASNFTLSLTASGLVGTLVVQDSQADSLTFTTDNTQTFTKTYASGTAYSVTIQTQPAGQTCTLSGNASGTITANTTVTATCASNFTLSVTATGLTGTLVVQDSQADSLTFTTNNTQSFAKTYANGAAYSVTIQTQPAGQTCTLSGNASGTMTANTTVTATCVSNFTLSVTPSGLVGTLVVQDSQLDSLTFTTNVKQTFTKTYASGAAYTVTIQTQPAGQTCTLSANASGTITANTTVTATCVSNFTISVTASGLSGTLAVQDDKADGLTFTTNNTQTFTTPYASGSTYAVTIATQPAGQTCSLSGNASGTISANTTVTATCVSNFTISVAVTGLNGTLVMQDSKADALTFTTNNTQTFATSYASGSAYTVSVQTQPNGQTCTLSANASGTITANTTVTATCSTTSTGLNVSITVTGLSGSVTMQDDQGDTLTFTNNSTQTFTKSYTSGAAYTVYVTSQPSAQACTPTYATGTITSNVTIAATCATGATRALGTVSGVTSVACQGALKNGVCQQLTVSCAGVPDVLAYVKTNTPTTTPLGTVTYNDGTQGNGLYESIYTFGSTAVGNVFNAGFTTVQISWGTPFNTNQPGGWVQGPGGVLAAACRYATVTQWIYNNIQNNTSIPMCATANSGGAGALAYALSQYPSSNVLSMAEVTSGPPTGRLDWGCGCKQGKVAVQCGTATTLGTCFGKTDGGVWDPAYNSAATTGVCASATGGTLPPGGLNFFLGDSAEAPGALYNYPKTHVNLVFGGADNSAAIPIGQDWFNNITTTKSQACVAGGLHSLANTQAGADQIANDLISMCKLQ